MVKTILSNIKSNWNDPVWSKVIASVIISTSVIILGSIYSIAASIYYSIPFGEAIAGMWSLLNKQIELKVWVILIFILIYLIFTFTVFIEFIKNGVQKINKVISSFSNTEIVELPSAPNRSTVFFHDRIASAFPGIRELAWFNDPKVATDRLMLLLRPPIRFMREKNGGESRPIWWFRGGRSLYIEKFKRLGNTKVLMNNNQLNIRRIAVYQSDSYYKDFVYVELEPEKKTGLYLVNDLDIKEHIAKYGYYREEYGILKSKYFGRQIFIKREDYDDGATVINGKVKDALNAELRTRYISKYNFIIAAKGSPFNSMKFDQNSKIYFDQILKKEIEPDDLFNFLEGFDSHAGPDL